MFDPTIFENLKVAIENELYDLDNLDHLIDIVARKDMLDMASMSRELTITFRLTGEMGITSELVLDTSLRDLATEILEIQGEKPACGLRFRFYMEIEGEGAERQCLEIERCISDIWMPEQKPIQTLSWIYGGDEGKQHYLNCIELRFHRRIGEEQMEDIPELIEHAIRTLEALGQL